MITLFGAFPRKADGVYTLADAAKSRLYHRESMARRFADKLNREGGDYVVLEVFFNFLVLPTAC